MRQNYSKKLEMQIPQGNTYTEPINRGNIDAELAILSKNYVNKTASFKSSKTIYILLAHPLAAIYFLVIFLSSVDGNFIFYPLSSYLFHQHNSNLRGLLSI